MIKSRRQGACFGRARGWAIGISILWGANAAQAQSMESQQEAFRLANDLSTSIREAFEGGDLRRGYAAAIAQLLETAEERRGSSAWGILQQIVANSAAGLGMHELALEVRGPVNALPDVPNGLGIEDAIGAIVHASAGRRVVMLNEAHHVSQHREFARRMLKPMRDAGFTHLACEAFKNSNEVGYTIDAQRLGYATRETGYYISDPFFAELVREAVELGFELVPYETLVTKPHGQESPAESINRREKDQAEQLAAVLESDPDARVFVFCGYSHLTESPLMMQGGETRWLAARLSEMTGIDPLTVSQTIYYPRRSEKQRVPGIAGYEHNDAFVLRAEDGFWSQRPDEYDIELLHPRTSPIDGRPAWMFRAADRTRVVLDLSAIELVEQAVLIVTRVGEAFNAIPSDVVLVEPAQSEVSVSLRDGEYRVWLVRSGQEPELLETLAVD